MVFALFDQSAFSVTCYGCFLGGGGVTVESAWLQGHGYSSTAPLARSRSYKSHADDTFNFYPYRASAASEFNL